ncbi:glycosyl transferase [Intestinibacter bartlettii]|uniref:glycosyl transferase n=2 Tax=Intestinibacter bartlettii TaxID=261299 RepID=UPI001D01F24D|nr:glycosyl transferase [Intestinibacter bartlettii]MCB5745216.1 glycosyl transferase [Intestinibacter bartlettii]MDU4257165.1 glycosyl transferase [Intestinibacter bartlettii]MDU6197266.1 glycosyl transferase [Intestinibacter bartlettii]
MSQYIFHAILFALGFLGTYFMIPLFKSMLVNGNVIRPNYKNEMIPVGMGIVFLPMIIINSIILGFVTLNNIWFVSSSNYNLNIVWLLCLALYIFSMMAMFFAGALDDLIGNRNVSGLKGHFKSLFKGELTTGGFKALFGGFVGLVVSVCISSSIVDIIVNTLIIALSTNLMNLFDLRPGRAIKVYLVIIIPIYITLTGYTKVFPLLILPNVLAYFNIDLKARGMMGDTGSNVLGISIGVLMALGYGIKVRLAWLVFLILMHLITEKFSLTKIIEKNRVLKFIDNLGR